MTGMKPITLHCLMAKSMRVLVTGATGNVGREVIRSLKALNRADVEVVAGVTSPDQSASHFRALGADVALFNFLNPASMKAALVATDVLFLLRPPQITDIDTCFKPLVQMAQTVGLKHIVFLSVQGAEANKIIPHHKIEDLLTASPVPYTFLRPAYFMQNFTTTLRKELVEHKRVYLPAGNAKFTLIDTCDIGRVAARVIVEYPKHIRQAYALTNHEVLSFREMAQQLSEELGTPIQFVSPNLISFFATKWREGADPVFIFVMMMLHFLPRFQTPPPTTDWVEQLTGAQPITFRQFVARNKTLLT